MKDSQNLILAIVLSLGVLLAWQFFVERPRQLAFQEQQQRQLEMTQPAAPETSPSAPTLKTPANENESLQPSPRIRILTPKLNGSLALRGARIDDLKLVTYHETVDPKSPEVVLLAPKGMKEAYFAEFGWTGASDSKVKTPGPDDEWKQVSGSDLTPNSPVTIAYDNGEGLLFTRTISVDENYLFVVSDNVKNTGTASQTLFPWGRIARYGKPKLSGYWILFEGMLGVFDGRLEEVKYKTVDEDKRVEKTSTGGWLGITDKYWLTALLPGADQHLTASFNHANVSGQDLYQADYLQSPQVLAPGESIAATGRLFAGAKEVSVIDAYERSQNVQLFDRAIDWGWFYFLTKPIFWALSTFNGWVGNFGVAILIFTLCVKTVFFPIANRQYESMSKMKKLQPEMKKLQERFKDDKMRLQQEMMELYKREKANPLSGCLPLLLQIPIFWSLYKVLVVTIEMRHAPFFGWIKDLSAPDPSNIFTLFGLIPWDPPSVLHFGAWPLIMGATYFVLQKLSPPPPDPTQARILSLLPLIMTISLAQVSAGLLIYWSWNNLLSILQQTLIMYRMGVPIRWGGASPTPTT